MIARASGAPEKTQQLNDELHRLHARASSPSIRTMAEECNLSTGAVYRLFSESTLPRPKPLLDIVEYLAKRCYKCNPDQICDYFDWLWRRAQNEWIPDPFAPPGEIDDDGPEPPPGLGIRPTRPKPTGPSGGAGAPGPRTESDDGEATDESEAQDLNPIVLDPWRSRALLIGVEHYNNLGSQGPFARDLHELGEIRDLLADSYRGGAELLVNPTRDQIWTALANTVAATDDTLLLHFAGHGFYDERTSDTYLAAADTTVTADGMVDNAIGLRDVRYLLTQGRAKNRIVVIDCCHSGKSGAGVGALRVVDSPPTAAAFFVDDNPALAFSSPGPTFVVGHRATPAPGGGVFTTALLEQLRLVSTNATEPVAAGAFYARLLEAVSQDVRQATRCQATRNGRAILITLGAGSGKTHSTVLSSRDLVPAVSGWHAGSVSEPRIVMRAREQSLASDDPVTAFAKQIRLLKAWTVSWRGQSRPRTSRFDLETLLMADSWPGSGPLTVARYLMSRPEATPVARLRLLREVWPNLTPPGSAAARAVQLDPLRGATWQVGLDVEAPAVIWQTDIARDLPTVEAFPFDRSITSDALAELRGRLNWWARQSTSSVRFTDALDGRDYEAELIRADHADWERLVCDLLEDSWVPACAAIGEAPDRGIDISLFDSGGQFVIMQAKTYSAPSLEPEALRSYLESGSCNPRRLFTAHAGASSRNSRVRNHVFTSKRSLTATAMDVLTRIKPRYILKIALDSAIARSAKSEM
jgi:hypothetical protein